MHASFLPLFGIAVFGTLLSAFVDHSIGRALGVAAGVLPLVWYHWSLRAKKSLTPDEIDSVYYFGFLVTVATLMFTTVSIGRGQAQLSLPAVLTQFGLGLIATAYGLFARLHLIATVGPRSEDEISKNNERLAQSVQEAASQFDVASHQVAAFVQRLNERLVGIDQTLATAETKLSSSLAVAETEFRARLSASAAAFSEELSQSKKVIFEAATTSIAATTQSYQQSVTALIAELQRAQAEAAQISFRPVADQLSGLAAQLTEAMSTVNSAARIAHEEASESIGELTSASRKTLLLVKKISDDLEALDGIKQLVESVRLSQEGLAQLSSASVTATNTISTLGATLRQFDGDVRTHLIDGAPTVALSTHMKAGAEALRNYAENLRQLRVPEQAAVPPLPVRKPEPSSSWWSR